MSDSASSAPSSEAGGSPQPLNTSTVQPFNDFEKNLIFSIKYARDAKHAAEQLLGAGVRIRTKIINGRSCIFVGSAQSTNYFGADWSHAFGVLLLHWKRGQVKELNRIAKVGPRIVESSRVSA